MTKTLRATFTIFDEALDYLLFKRPIALFLVLTLGIFCWYGSADKALQPTEEQAQSENAKLRKYLHNRPFIDQFPIDPRKTYHIYVFTKQGNGAFITSQNFKQVIEIFFYSVKDNKLKYWFPNAKQKGTTHFKLEDSRGPGTFDIKLVLREDPKNNKRPKPYYSWKKYKPRKDVSASPHWLEENLKQIRQHLETLEKPAER